MDKLPALCRFMLAVVLLSGFTPRCNAQSAEGRLGDSTITPLAPSQAESYGVNAPVESLSTTTFATRHTRRGNSGGIGGSYLGTESVTAETQPVTNYTSTPQLKMPSGSMSDESNGQRTFSETMLYSPALSPTPNLRPGSSELNAQSYNPAEFGKIDSLPYNMFWGRKKKPRGSFQPSPNAFQNFDLMSK